MAVMRNDALTAAVSAIDWDFVLSSSKSILQNPLVRELVKSANDC